jgi:diaminopimelate epimerase
MARLRFAKMAGAGNDFIVLDNRKGVIPEERGEFIARISERRISVGADGVLLVEPSDLADFRMRYYNADGGEAEMCGNGARCIARFAYLKRIARRRMTFESQAGLHHSEVTPTGAKLSMTDPTVTELHLGLHLEKGELTVHSINTGVPHVVVFVDDLDAVEVEKLGREIRYHRRFSPAGTNATFVQPLDPQRAAIRTYERGVEGETLACGTGAVAAAVVGGLLGRLEPPVTIEARGGPLYVGYTLDGEGVHAVSLDGEARLVYEGSLSDEASTPAVSS